MDSLISNLFTIPPYNTKLLTSLGVTYNVINTVIKEVSKINKLHSVILFGSVARGEVDRLSDVDLLLICEDDFKARKAVYELDPPLDVTVHSPKDMIQMARLGLPILHHLALEGRILIDDGTFKKVLLNLKETDEHTLKLLVSETKVTMQKCSLLSEFKETYLAHLFRLLLNLIEADLCFHGYKIFEKDEALKKFFVLHPKLSSLKETMLNLLNLYRSYTRSEDVHDVNLKNLPKKIEQILEVIEHELSSKS